MSPVRLFRQEALKHQFQNKEFGEPVIQAPVILDRLMFTLFAAILTAITIILYKSITVSYYEFASLSPSNYSPILLSKPIVVTQHLVTSGNEVNKSQQVVSVRLINEELENELQQNIQAPISGVYFSTSTPGTFIAPYTVIGQILKDTMKLSQTIAVSVPQVEGFHVGQTLELKINNHKVRGEITSTESLTMDSSLLVRLIKPYQLVWLTPNANIQIKTEETKRNVFALLGQ